LSKPITPSVTVPSTSRKINRTRGRGAVISSIACASASGITGAGVAAAGLAGTEGSASFGSGMRPLRDRLARPHRVVEERRDLVERQLGGGVGQRARGIGVRLEEDPVDPA